MDIYLKELSLWEIHDILDKELKSRNNYIWTTKDGTNINIKDMTDSHLKNTINKLSELRMIQGLNGDIDNIY